MEYYFLVWEYKKITMENFRKLNKVIDKHPVVWLKEMTETYPEVQVRILFYQEIEKEHFDLINGMFD